MTNLKQLQKVCKEVNEKMDVISEEELKEIVGRYYKDDVISCRQWDFLIGYIERKEKISDSFAFMYSEQEEQEMNKIDYNTKPTEKGIDNFIWVHETKIKQAENDIESLKKDLILDVNDN